MHDLTQTVVAVATPPGRGGVGCLRISGARAREIADRLFEPASGRAAKPGGAPRFGVFRSRDGKRLDHGYLLLFAQGRSYTGELTAELWSHGSPAVLQELLEGAVGAGARLAGPGEMTYRALRNGRMDLARAEAVADLIEARTVYQARVAFAQAEGALSRRVAPLRESLEEWIARGEAAVEFVEESETFVARGELRRAVGEARTLCDELLRDFRTGRLLRDGAGLVVIGLPNAGKSSLFNRLLAEERAIVHAVAGTTRDTLEETLELDGILVRLTDTAGLRRAPDPVEEEGIRRAEKARAEADLVLLVFDGSREPEPEELEALTEARGGPDARRTVTVVTKCDLPGAREREIPDPSALRVSAVTGEGIDALRAELRARLVGETPVEDPLVTNTRHARALEETREALERAAHAGDAGLSEELILEDLREAMRRLGTITGEFTTEELYDRIFSTFCIGK